MKHEYCEKALYKYFMNAWISEDEWNLSTEEQKDALNRVALTWSKCWKPFSKAIGDDYLFGQVGSEDAPMIWLGIERDGYCHS